jgi:pyruvate formate lyase activating enzyme
MTFMKKPLIFDIKRGSIDDGSGIRTVLFFKGCPLNCSWCHNPESKKCEVEYFYDCGEYEPIGKSYEFSELLSIVQEDSAFYKVSGGGVTFSGGEPTFSMRYVSELAKILHKNGISCALQTSGYFDFSDFQEQLLPYLDCIFFDIKLMDSAEHIRHTGKDNGIILENLSRLLRLSDGGIRIIPRTPLIPGITDTDDNLDEISCFLRELGLEELYVKLKYNDGGARKCERLVSKKI